MANTAAPSTDPVRFEIPLYTLAEGARYLRVRPTTFSTWAQGYRRYPPGRSAVKAGPIITATKGKRGEPRLPFVGLAEAHVVAALRRGLGEQPVSLQRIRHAVGMLRQELGVEHALAQRSLYTDGAQLLYAYDEAAGGGELAGLTELVSGQRVFREVVRDYLKRITYGDDGWAARLQLPETDLLEVDPHVGFGRPLLVGYGVPVEAARARIRAGESAEDVADDFEVPVALLNEASQALAD